MDEKTDDDPRCDKCGAPITTGLMAVFCPAGRQCEFWTEGVDEFAEDLGLKRGTPESAA